MRSLSSGGPHCALETPASGSQLVCSLAEPGHLWLPPGHQQQLGCDGGEGVCTTKTPPSLGAGGSNSSGDQGNELSEQQRARGGGDGD